MVAQTHHFRVLQTNSMRFFKQISTINSMIFKTMDNELKVFGKTILTTTEHLKNLETVNATVYNKNGQFNLQGLSINTSQSVSNFTKLNNAFKAYNGNLTKSTHLQNAYIKAVGNQNGALGNYLAGLNGAKASMGGYIKSLVGAKAATIGLQVASTLLNTALSLGLSLALSAIVSGITHLVNKEKEAREQAIENAQTAKEEADNLTELLNKYNQLSEEVKTNTGVKDDLLETQGELLESLGIEQSQLDGLIKKYGDLNTAINKVTLDSLNDAQADLMVAVDAREKELINVGKDYKHWFSLTDRNLISTGGEESKQAYDILAKAGVISQGSVGTGGGVFTLVGDDKTVDGILENYQKLKEAQTALNEAVSNGEISKEDMGSNPLYKAINSRLDELKTAVDNYNSAIKDVNENSANQEIISNLIGKDLPQTEEEFETFKQSLIDSAQASNNFIGSQEDIKNSIIDALAEMPEFEKYFEDLAQAESDVQHETPISLLSISETVDAVNTKLKPALDSLKTVYQSIFSSDGFTLDNVDVSMLESLKKSFEDLKENGIDIATEDFENFTRVITDSSTTSEEAQHAFNKLATTLVNNSKVALVSDDAFNTLVQTLEQLGITNAEEALQGLRDIQSEIASKGYDLANITNEQAAAFINEGNASAEAVAYLQYYMIQKQLAEQPLSTVGDVESLENLCNTLGVTGEMLQEVINLKNMMNAVNAGAPTAEFMPRIEESKKKIAELAKGEFEYKFDFKPKLDSSKASGSAKDIAEEFKNLLDAELKVLDTKMDAGLINFNDYIVQRLALIQKYYDEGKIKASDYYDYLSKHYETQLSYMDKVTSYVTTRIDKEIDGYNKQIDQIKEKYQTEIDYLDTVIDYYEKQKEALQDANTQRELQLALQKALYDLEKAQTQRSRKIYADNHGYIYRADGDAIRDAQDNLNKAKLDIQINEIDKAIKKVQEQQDALKKAMDKEVEAINKIIENLEAYKEKWSSIAKEYEEKQNEMIAQQMLGADIEKEILAGRLDVLEDFKNKYLAIQQAIKDANANAAQAALNEANKPSTGGSGSGSGNGTKITTTPKSPLVSDTEKKRIQEENKQKNKKKKQRLTGGGTKKLVVRYANGTKNAEPGYHEIAENGDELIRDNYGNAYIAKGHQLHNFEGGETVYDAGDTKELLGGRLVPIESMPGISESLKNLMAYANTPDASQLRIQPNIPDYNILKSVDSKSSTNSQVYVTQNVNVTLPNVTNEAGFNNFKKELDRLKLDAYQFANKRNK